MRTRQKRVATDTWGSLGLKRLSLKKMPMVRIDPTSAQVRSEDFATGPFPLLTTTSSQPTNHLMITDRFSMLLTDRETGRL